MGHNARHPNHLYRSYERACRVDLTESIAALKLDEELADLDITIGGVVSTSDFAAAEAWEAYLAEQAGIDEALDGPDLEGDHQAALEWLADQLCEEAADLTERHLANLDGFHDLMGASEVFSPEDLQWGFTVSTRPGGSHGGSLAAR